MSSLNYTTVQGDTWASISNKMYGTTKSIQLLIDANKAVPLDPILPEMIQIVVPIIDDTDSSVNTENLPPWK